MTATRVCRVAVDVLAVERLFDYTVPEGLADIVGVGTIVRVNLGGRRVRAWVVDDDVISEAPPAKLRPLLAAVSAGPPPEIVSLTAWAAHRFAGPRLPLLRAASPPAIVSPAAVPSAAVPSAAVPSAAGPPPAGAGSAAPSGQESCRSSGTIPAETLPASADPASVAALSAPSTGDAAEGVAELAADAAGRAFAIVRWPPAADRAELLAALLAPAGSTIVVVPEGRLGRLGGALRASGATVVPWLAEGRPRDRARAWDRARRGACIVLGGRSAVLAPVPDLAAVVVVDDGSEALKEERSPTWHARDVAAERARRAGARLTLLSPVPPLEAPGPVLAPARVTERAGWPITEVVDRRHEPPGLGLFSERAVAALRAAVAAPRGEPERSALRNGGQTAQAPPPHDARAVCVLNRKGRARLLACAACGELARCERCETAVAEVDAVPADGGEGPTAAVRILACSICGVSRPRVCTRCGSTKLKVLRSGVTRVREDLAALLPGVPVAMVDAATGDLPGEPVLIGTEAVLHRVEPHPGGSTALVVFLDFDAELLAPRFRAGEQALWLVVRAGRLVGPKAAGGRVLVQTRLPRHEVIEAAVRADPALLADAEGPRRKLLDLPPYSSLARLTGDAPALAAAAGSLRSAGGVGVSEGTGGAVLVRAPSPERLADALSAALAAGRPAGRLRAEVDPLRV